MIYLDRFSLRGVGSTSRRPLPLHLRVPTAFTQRAAVTVLSIPPEMATIKPLRLNCLARISFILFVIRSTSFAQSIVNTSLENDRVSFICIF